MLVGGGLWWVVVVVVVVGGEGVNVRLFRAKGTAGEEGEKG